MDTDKEQDMEQVSITRCSLFQSNDFLITEKICVHLWLIKTPLPAQGKNAWSGSDCLRTASGGASGRNGQYWGMETWIKSEWFGQWMELARIEIEITPCAGDLSVGQVKIEGSGAPGGAPFVLQT
jgi:hypothetical protein